MTKLPVAIQKRSKLRWLYYTAFAFLALLIILSVGVYLYGYTALKGWVESSSGQSAASKGLGNAIKVDGQFNHST